MATGTTTIGREATTRREDVPVIDTDAHNFRMPAQLAPYLPERWRSYLETFGTRTLGMMGLIRFRSGAARSDAWPPNGMLPGEDPEFTREQLLDRWGIDYAILNHSGASIPNFSGGNQPTGLTAALMHAANDHTEAEWLSADPRWLGSICVPWEDAPTAAREIAERREGPFGDRWVQVILSMGSEQPYGRRRYWDLWEAAEHYGVPVGFHPGDNGLNPPTGAGWPSFYMENHAGYPQQLQSQIASFIFEGVFDRFPGLKLVSVEGNYSWAVPFAWRLDASWRMLKDEVPHLQRKPSEYLADHLWFTTQPFEEPENPAWFTGICEQLEGAGFGDKLMFSSDYPHWDFDSPRTSLPAGLPDELYEKIMWRNASKLYGLTVG